MPNHVFNNIGVTGSEEAITAFKEKASMHEREFSYWNFVTPPKEAVDSGEYWATNGFIAGEKSGDTANNWYNFNTREWGTKWDTYDLSAEVAPKAFYANFSSAWSPPIQVFEAIVAQHPELSFQFSWEEEQGWGGEATGYKGSFIIQKEWDIPDSHADYVHLGWEDRCNCNSEDDREYWFKDCPKAQVAEHEGCNCSNHKKEKVNG